MTIQNRIYLYWYTIRYLKWIQIFYRIFYFVRPYIRRFTKHQYHFDLPCPPYQNLRLIDSISAPTPQIGEYQTFIFLNISYSFKSKIDWDYAAYGKLWTYNLNYFEFLHQKDVSSSHLMALMKDFVAQLPHLRTAIEPFPIALRAIFWIRFFVKYPQCVTQEAVQSLYCQLKILQDKLEYHILGNHLLENGFSLLFGAYFFEDKSFYHSAKQILVPELKEQILSDGAHFELSPMYHQIMLYRVLDCINLMESNPTFNNELLPLFQEKASIMLSWLKQITFANGDIPHLNDSTACIAPTTQDLLHYAHRLKINHVALPLSESGYRCFNHGKYELRVDVGNIASDYIPGHSHSDIFNFVLNIDNQPFIIDRGISTYEKNEKRQLERSTESHNTVQIGNEEQSDIWGGFRVGRRAKVVILQYTQSFIKAAHDGYDGIGVRHTRQFDVSKQVIMIVDKINHGEGKAYFHFHPGHRITLHGDVVNVSTLSIKFTGSQKIEMADYSYADGFNILRPAKKITVWFNNILQTTLNVE